MCLSHGSFWVYITTDPDMKLCPLLARKYNPTLDMNLLKMYAIVVIDGICSIWPTGDSCYISDIQSFLLCRPLCSLTIFQKFLLLTGCHHCESQVLETFNPLPESQSCSMTDHLLSKQNGNVTSTECKQKSTSFFLFIAFKTSLRRYSFSVE